jgi:D-3-phosphoglycerate dehydrogenase
MATNRKRILLPHTISRAAWAIAESRDDIELKSFPNDIKPENLPALLEEVSGIALGATPFGTAALAAAPKMEVVARIGVGYDAVDVPALTARRIPLMIAGIANSVSVAENAMFFMMTLAKRGVAMDAIVREGRWWDKYQQLPVDLFEKTVLIVGFGRIGTRIAKRCLAHEMQVLVSDPYVDEKAIREAGCEPVRDLDTAISRADFITIHCPKTPETTGLFNEARLARMKPGAYIVNTARGGIIDERALHSVLSAARIAGAGIDVFEREPPAVDHPLFKLENVVTGPHVAGVTREAVDRMGIAAVRNILSMLDGKPIRENVVNSEVLD